MSQDLRTEYRGRILKAGDLPTLPKVLDEVNRLMEDPNSSTDQIAKVVSLDQALTARILKMVNSPIYGFPGRIGALPHAMVLLGLNVVRGVLISASVMDMMNKASVGLWRHSLGCAMAATETARVAGLDDPEEYSVPGLLHDLGKMAVALQIPELQDDMKYLVEVEDMTMLAAERQLMGFTHARVGAWLADHWRLPPFIKEGMVHHHAPDKAEHYPLVPAVVHVADFLVRLFEYGSGGDGHIPYLEPAAVDRLGIKFKDMEKVMDALAERLTQFAGYSFS